MADRVRYRLAGASSPSESANPWRSARVTCRKRLAGRRQKLLDVGTVGPLSMFRPAVQPDFKQLGVGVSPRCRGDL